MKRFTAAILVLLMVLSACILSTELIEHYSLAGSAQPEEAFCVIIDAGHGGMDGGTSAADGTREKDINLSIAKKLNMLLCAAGFKTVMLRQSDELIGDNSLSTVKARKISDIRARLAAIESCPKSILISLHQNHYGVEKYSGAQVFYAPNGPESQNLAACVQQSITELLQPENTRQIKKTGTDIYLLYNSPVPSVMVECGFLSNLQEAQLLKTEKYQTQIAFSIMHGIFKYLE